MILEWFGVFMFSCELLSLLIKNSIWDYVCELLVCYVQYHAIMLFWTTLDSIVIYSNLTCLTTYFDLITSTSTHLQKQKAIM